MDASAESPPNERQEPTNAAPSPELPRLPRVGRQVAQNFARQPFPSPDDSPRHKRDHLGRILFDLGVVKGLGQIGATAREMAAVLGCSKRCLTERMSDPDDPFCVAYEMGRQELAGSLRRKQIAVAMQGNVRMLQWMGMQLLDQKNVAKMATENLHKVEGEFTFTIKQGADEEGKEVVDIQVEEPAAAEDDDGT